MSNISQQGIVTDQCVFPMQDVVVVVAHHEENPQKATRVLKSGYEMHDEDDHL